MRPRPVAGLAGDQHDFYIGCMHAAGGKNGRNERKCQGQFHRGL